MTNHRTAAEEWLAKATRAYRDRGDPIGCIAMDQLATAHAILAGHPDVRVVWKDPSVTEEEMRDLVRTIRRRGHPTRGNYNRAQDLLRRRGMEQMDKRGGRHG